MNTSGGQAGVHAGPVHHPQPHPPGPPQASTGHPQQAVHPAHPTQVRTCNIAEIGTGNKMCQLLVLTIFC